MMSKPVMVGQELCNQVISEMSKLGDGVVRFQTLVIFVPDVQLGERVNIRITRVGNNYAEAEVLNA